MIVPMDSEELQEFSGTKCIDYTEKNPHKLPYVIVCEHSGILKKVYIQMKDELYKE